MQENELYVQCDLGTGAGKSVGTLLLLVGGDLCYESVPGPLLRLIFQGMLACWETVLTSILMFFCSAF